MAARMLVLVALAFMPIAAASGEHPIEKVVDMLKDLKAKSIEEGQAEEVDFGKFTYWCKTSIAELDKAIEKEKENIETLEDKIEGLKKEKKSLEDQIKELEKEIGELQADATAAKKKDEDRTTAYTAKKADLKETATAIGDAITAMQGAKSDTGLVQAQSAVFKALAFLSMKASDKQRATLVDFVSADPKDRPDQKAAGDQAAHVKKYSFKSDNVIDLLKELKLKFEDDLVAADTEETDGANSYALEKNARDAAEAAATKSKTQKEINLGAVETSLGDAENDLINEKADKEADDATLKSTDSDCKTKTGEWEERSKVRKGELEALTEGIRILAKSAGVRTEAPSNPIPPASPVSFLQVLRSRADPKQQAVNLLRKTALTVHSKALERLALEVSTHLTGPFDKVNDMIQKMIFRLMAEQTDEDKHKAWCDLETDKTETAITDKTTRIGELEADIEENKASEAQLVLDIADADKMVADITKFMDEATEIRQAGKSENNIAIKDAKQAQTAIANAVAVLEDFYKESGGVPKEPWEFIQAPVTLPKDPKLWDSPAYTGQGGQTSILAILETTAADFSKMEAETKAQEAEDQKAYDDTMKEHKVEKDRRRAESEAKVAEKKRKVQKIGQLEKSKKNTNDELDAVKKYEKDLQPTCVDGDSTYDDRKAARTKEVDALKTAQTTLKEAFEEKSLIQKSAPAFLQIRRHA